MKKIDISNAPAYTSPNSMTLLCTENRMAAPTLQLWHFGLLRPPIPAKSCSP